MTGTEFPAHVVSALEAARRRFEQAHEEQLRQFHRQAHAQEELWELIDQFEEICIQAAQHMAVFQEAGMELPEIAKLMCVPRGVARMFLEVAEKAHSRK